MTNSPKYHTLRLINLMQTYQSVVAANQPANRVTSETCTIIDLFITNNDESIIDSGVYPVSISDHNVTVRKIGIPRNLKHFDERKFKSDFQSAKWPKINNKNDVVMCI